MSKTKTILELTKKSNYKSLYLDNLDKRYLANNDKNIKISNITSISDLFISEHNTST